MLLSECASSGGCGVAADGVQGRFVLAAMLEELQ